MKASILLITYNHEKYIDQAITSVLMQRDLPDVEIIISDDASKDKTLEIVSNRLSGMSNVFVNLNQHNIGITRNYQKALSLCKGEYVFVLEGDDYWVDPYKVKRQVEFLDQNPFCSMCFHPFIYQEDDSAIFHNNFKNETGLASDLFCLSDILLNESLIGNFSVCCYRKAALDQLPKELFDIVSYDWIVNISIAQFGFLGRINSPMSVYRLIQNSTWSNKPLKERLGDTLKLIPDYDRVLEYRFTDLFQKKMQILNSQIKAEDDFNNTSLQKYIPPAFLYLMKYMTPPAVLSFLRKKIRNV